VLDVERGENHRMSRRRERDGQDRRAGADVAALRRRSRRDVRRIVLDAAASRRRRGAVRVTADRRAAPDGTRYGRESRRNAP
jgi:hypothetical protein